MSQVNLLPPESLQRQRLKRLTLAILIAGAAILGLVLAFYLLQAKRLADVHDDIQAQEQTNNQLQTDIANLQHFADLQVEAQAKQSLLSAAYSGEVSMSQMLLDLSSVTPPESYIDTLTITMSQQTGLTAPATTTEPTTPFVGTLTFGGQAIGFTTLGTWLVRVEQIDGWVNPWMPSITVADATIDSFTFSVSIDLTSDVLTPRGSGQVTSSG
jgi:Tfp pilus assembly protein PilN